MVPTRERYFLEHLDKHQRRYLSRRMCFLCGKPLNRPGCQNTYKACTDDCMIMRIENCLAEYQPRMNRRKQ